ncbi:hypothetical protein NO098_320003 [Flavobacterium psychrophilum]|nr:hypothetical protein NO098_320003 [Flavobacterium psychrophilum]
MTTSEYILQSKKDIKISESVNVTYELLKNYEELSKKNTDNSFFANYSCSYCSFK